VVSPSQHRPRSRQGHSVAVRRLLAETGTETLAEAVEALAGRLLPDPLRLPVDLHLVGKTLGVVDVEATDDLMGSGELVRHLQGWRIRYSGHMSIGRQRFTHAHELAHLSLIQHKIPRAHYHEGDIERICDALAAAIIMPAAVVLEVIASHRPGVSRILIVARRCGSSTDAAAIRIHELVGQHFLKVGRDGAVLATSGVVREQAPMEIMSCVDSVSAGVREWKGVRLEHNSFWNGLWSVDAAPLSHGSVLFSLLPEGEDVVVDPRSRRRFSSAENVSGQP